MDIQKFCLQDGPGIRTTVFLKGCNMKCKWCHNPESMEAEPTLMYFKNKCNNCKACENVCSFKVHDFSSEYHALHRNRCIKCGKCVEVCLQQALDIIGKEYTVEQVMNEIVKDEKYYLTSNGGVTFSGGESTLQFDFLLELMQQCKQRNYHIALETNGLFSEEKLLALMDYTDLFLFDYKLTDEEEHIKWTGVSQKVPLRNLIKINELKGTVHLRCPIIPGLNDSENHFETIRKFKQCYHCIKQIEIMAYHDTGVGKWEACGKTYKLPHIKTVNKIQKEEWEKYIG